MDTIPQYPQLSLEKISHYFRKNERILMRIKIYTQSMNYPLNNSFKLLLSSRLNHSSMPLIIYILT